MPRTARQVSETSIYHVVQRGIGQQILFEDDEDYYFFLDVLRRYIKKNEEDIELLAWCLMSNHTHLLIRADIEVLSNTMRQIGLVYARYFNNRYTRTGHLFQDRFYSETIKDETQFMETVRYIHENPAKAGITSWPWTSYEEIIGRSYLNLCNASYVIGAFRSLDAFISFHEEKHQEGKHLDIRVGSPKKALPEKEAIEIAKQILGDISLFDLKKYGREFRDDRIIDLGKAGLSIRQIARITGLGLGVVSRACNRELQTTN